MSDLSQYPQFRNSVDYATSGRDWAAVAAQIADGTVKKAVIMERYSCKPADLVLNGKTPIDNVTYVINKLTAELPKYKYGTGKAKLEGVINGLKSSLIMCQASSNNGVNRFEGINQLVGEDGKPIGNGKLPAGLLEGSWASINEALGGLFGQPNPEQLGSIDISTGCTPPNTMKDGTCLPPKKSNTLWWVLGVGVVVLATGAVIIVAKSGKK